VSAAVRTPRELPVELIVPLNAEHIREGVPSQCAACPLALAFEDALGGPYRAEVDAVGIADVAIDGTPVATYVPTTMDATRFVAKFDTAAAWGGPGNVGPTRIRYRRNDDARELDALRKDWCLWVTGYTHGKAGGGYMPPHGPDYTKGFYAALREAGVENAHRILRGRHAYGTAHGVYELTDEDLRDLAEHAS